MEHLSDRQWTTYQLSKFSIFLQNIFLNWAVQIHQFPGSLESGEFWIVQFNIFQNPGLENFDQHLNFLSLNKIDFFFVRNIDFKFWLRFKFFHITFVFQQHVFVSLEISLFDQNFYFWPKCLFLTKMSIFEENRNFWRNFVFFTKISIFDQNFYYWATFLFLTKIFIFEQNFYFSPKFLFFTKISIFHQNFDFSP